MTTEELEEYLTSWLLNLRAENKSAQTIKVYGDGVRRFMRWCDENDLDPDLNRATVNSFVSAILADGAEPATARSRQLALKRLSAWMFEEEYADEDAIAALKPPKLTSKIVPLLTDDQLKALIDACKGKDFRSRRDEALVRFMSETAARAGETLALQVADVSLKDGRATIRQGKGGKERHVPFQAQTGRSLDRYLWLRKKHKLATSSNAFWLGDRNRKFGYTALYGALGYRAELAGIKDFYPHMLRSTAAGRWLAKGGSEGGLMSIAGWSRREMLDRYTQATSAQRAAEEARRLNLGDV